jgi:molecular chaperone DnaK (HSP70)
LNVLRIINEPTAAAIAYGLNRLDANERMKNVLVFDLGGGTFDVSLLTLDNGVFEVLATNGNTHLGKFIFSFVLTINRIFFIGGEDFDQRVMDYFIELFQSKTRKNIRKNIGSVEKLRREVEKAKRILSSENKTKVEIESFFDNIDFSEILTRTKFEELNSDLFQSTLIPVERVIEDAGLRKLDIDEVILVGGSTRIPKIRQLLKEYFNGKEPSRGVNPDEAVGMYIENKY